MTLSRIVLRLARNPGTEFADGDDHRGYALVAPLSEDGHLDVAAFRANADQCTVRRFAPDEDPIEGRLVHTGERWRFDYPDLAAHEDEAVYRLKDHRFEIGAYVAIADEDGRLLTYKVTDIQPV